MSSLGFSFALGVFVPVVDLAGLFPFGLTVPVDGFPLAGLFTFGGSVCFAALPGLLAFWGFVVCFAVFACSASLSALSFLQRSNSYHLFLDTDGSTG